MLVAGAVGVGAEDFGDDDWGASGWYGRARYGVSESTDVGVDIQGVDGLDVLSGKTAVRYAFSSSGCVDVGLGVGKVRDGDYGKSRTSVSGDAGFLFEAPVGSSDHTVYAGARAAWARSHDAPNVSYLYGVLGASLSNTSRSRVLIEGALGHVSVNPSYSHLTEERGVLGCPPWVGFRGKALGGGYPHLTPKRTPSG